MPNSASGIGDANAPVPGARDLIFSPAAQHPKQLDGRSSGNISTGTT